MNKFDQIITLTDVDKKLLKEAGVVVPIAVSPASVNAIPMDYSPWNGSITFLGGYAHIPNSEGVNWLINNSYKYGFILRYPKNMEDRTGYNYEPWHFRYVGNIAPYLYKNNMLLEDYHRQKKD